MKFKFFTAGPVSVSADMTDLRYVPVGHREPEFSRLFNAVTRKLLLAFGGDENHMVLLVSGSGTAALECVLGSVVGDQKILVVRNGAFGDRLFDICRFHGLNVGSLDFGWRVSVDCQTVAERVADVQPRLLAMVHHETSTGALNPIHVVGEICHKYNVSFIVDAMSSFCGAPLSVVGDHIDFAVSNTNKCLGGLPVLSFICVNRHVVEKMRGVTPKSYYLNLFKHFDYALEGQTPNTPQIPLVYMLDKALDELFVEGLQNRFRRFKENALLLRKTLRANGFNFFLGDSQMGPIVTNVLIPPNVSYDQVHLEMKRRGYIIYPGKAQLRGKVFNVGHIGTLTRQDILDFCSDLAQAVFGYCG